MTMTLSEERIVLSGTCGVEEAEALLAALTDTASRMVVIDAEKVHTAVWQVLLAAAPPLQPSPHASFVSRQLAQLVIARSAARAAELGRGADGRPQEGAGT